MGIIIVIVGLLIAFFGFAGAVLTNPENIIQQIYVALGTLGAILGLILAAIGVMVSYIAKVARLLDQISPKSSTRSEKRAPPKEPSFDSPE